MIAIVLNGLASIVCFAIAVRILTFRRKKKAHNYAVAAIAWLFINLLTAYAVWLAFAGIKPAAVAFVNVIFLICVMRISFKAQGNIKRMLRLTYDFY